MPSPNNHQEIPDCPYQGLMPYLEEHADFFFGREKWSAIITDNLIVSRLTLLYGTSGVGKTSVLRAGVAHHLRQMAQKNLKESGQPEFAVVVFNAWRDEPVVGLLQKVEKDVKKIWPAVQVPERGASLAKTLENWANVLVTDPERSGKLFIILDQFEEYFLYHRHEDKAGTFAVEFSRAVSQSGLPVNFLISLREDALAKLDYFKGRISNLFGNYLRILHLDEESAVDAIRQPLRVFNQRLKPEAKSIKSIGIETELVQEILEQVKVGKVSLVESGKGGVDRQSAETKGEIETSYLQLVMERLWKEEMKIGSDCLRLETFKRLGEAENIVKQHLNERMESLSREEKKIAAQVFEYLVTPGGTKITYPALELAEKGKVETQKLEDLLEKLSGQEQRILRKVGPSPEKPTVERYEIFHDTLAPAILEWRKEYQQQQENKNLQWKTFGFVGIAAVIAALMSILFVQAEIQRLKAAVSETKSIIVSSDQLADNGKYFDSLIHDLRAFKKLKQIDNNLSVKILPFLISKQRNELRVNIQKVLQHRLTNVNKQNELAGHEEEVKYVSFSPDGETLVTHSKDGLIKLWSLAGKQLSKEMKVGENPSKFRGVNFQSIEATTTLVDNFLTEEDCETLENVSHCDEVSAVSFSPNGQMIATASKDGTVKLWDRNGQFLRTLVDDFLTKGDCERFKKSFKQVSHCHEVLAVSFGPNSQMIATASKDQTVKLWSRDGQFLETLVDDSLTDQDCERFKQVSHCDEVWDVSFSHNGEMIATASRDKTVKLWDRNERKLVRTLRGHTDGVLSVSFNHEDRMLASAGYDSNVLLWNTNDGNLIKMLSGHKDTVRRVSFSPKSQMLASVSWNGIVKLWQINSNPLPSLTGHTNWVFDVSFSHNGQIIATASRDNTVKLWQRNGKLLQTLEGHNKAIWDVSFSLDDKTIATASQDQTVKLWEQQEGTWKVVKTLEGHNKGVLAVTFRPKGQIMATASDDSTVKLWEQQEGTWEVVQPLEGHNKGFSDVSFRLDGQTLATASHDETVQLWEKQNGQWKFFQKLDQKLDGHTSNVLGVSFSPDGQILATASQDATVKLWNKKDEKNGKWLLLTTLYGHNGSVWAVNFSSNDDSLLASASSDGTVILWNRNLKLKELLELDTLVDESCRWVRGYLENNPDVKEDDKTLCKHGNP